MLEDGPSHCADADNMTAVSSKEEFRRGSCKRRKQQGLLYVNIKYYKENGSPIIRRDRFCQILPPIILPL